MQMDFESAVWLYCSALAAAIPVLIPALQFGVVFRLWDQYNKPVNRDYCQCSCWDTVFKGREWNMESAVNGATNSRFLSRLRNRRGFIQARVLQRHK
jgi:hypothetical protein